MAKERTGNGITEGTIWKQILLFFFPILFGTLFLTLYNTIDAIIVGQALGKEALAAVSGGTSTLTNLIIGFFTGVAGGATVVISQAYGAQDGEKVKKSLHTAICLSIVFSLVISIGGFLLTKPMLTIMATPKDIFPLAESYLRIYFLGSTGLIIFNMSSGILRAFGDSRHPLWFLVIGAILNIILDILFIAVFRRGVKGAAEATVISEYISGMGVAIYTLIVSKESRFSFKHVDKKTIGEVSNFSFLTCLQQSVMNLGILMVQGRVNSFGPVVMAAFSTGVKIDAFAYMPLQDYVNAFSTFTAQNYGAEKKDRIKKGMSVAFITSLIFSLIISLLVFILSPSLMTIFVGVEELEIISVGTGYLRVEGAFYALIGFLFLFYGLYRGVGKPGMSFILTIISLGSRVLLSYTISGIPYIGVYGIWWSVPIGWLLADIVGALYYIKKKPLLMIENTKRRKESKKWQKGLERVK